MAQFFDIPDDVTIWKILDSQFLTSILAAVVGFYLLRRERLANDRADRAQAAVVEAQEEASAALDALRIKERVADRQAVPNIVEIIAPQDQRDANRQDAVAIINRAKAKLRTLVDADLDQRHQKTYSKISWHYPEEKAFALFERDQIAEAQYDAAFEIFELWRPYSRGRGANTAVPLDLLARLRGLIEVLEGQE